MDPLWSFHGPPFGNLCHKEYTAAVLGKYKFGTSDHEVSNKVYIYSDNIHECIVCTLSEDLRTV